MCAKDRERILVFDVVLPGGENEQFFQRLYPLEKRTLHGSSGGMNIVHAVSSAATFDMGIVQVTREELADLVGGRACVVLSPYGHQVRKIS